MDLAGERRGLPRSMYAGRPLLVTTNDYGLDLYNGDTGVVLVRDGRLVAAFDSGTGVREVAAARLSDVETMYAATVHRVRAARRGGSPSSCRNSTRPC